MYQIPGSVRTLPARSADELLRNWHRQSRFFKSPTLSGYMAQFADVFHQVSGGLQLRTDTPENFVADLIQHGWLGKA
ncbi:hypothetical protein G8759_19940 [Spirosoma aureum]|uniref:Uncharacterized protein n=1 Tax=Spirosoma aureum TaxID=2692134 RepID=A0A6G9AR81_9BACT|nr:hypothetical protein [Spirosoma aureum]QIP14723.1 hypothetical protein G8759_19940 [Spirosoma aureum]